MLPSKEEIVKLGIQDQIFAILDYLAEQEREEAAKFGIKIEEPKKKKR